MTAATTLRRAATLMRERAEAATGMVWSVTQAFGGQVEADAGRPNGGEPLFSGCCSGDGYAENFADAEHIAGMSPVVALAVAESLDKAAVLHSWEQQIGVGPVSDVVAAALAVACAYLGEDA